MATRDDSEIPESGAVFTFGKSKFADNIPNKFWVKNDRVLQIACGDEHTALIAETGRVFMFGPNDWGQLGLGMENKGANKPSCIKSLKHEKAKLVACGRSHTLISTESGTVYSFGSNSEGQLGIANITDSFTPKIIESLQANQFKTLAAGSDSSIILTEEGKVFAWGGNEDGKLGLGDKETVMDPTSLEMEQPVVCIACGYYHTALVTEDGKLYTMGESENGKLGLPDDSEETNVPQEVTDIPEPVKLVSCGSTHTVALTETGDVYVFGGGESGQLGLGTEILSCSKPTHLKIPFKVSQVCCGQAFTALISEKGQLYTFGDGRHGKLAHGSDQFSNQFRPYHCKRFSKFFVDKVACGGCHMIVTARPKALNGMEEVDDDKVDEMKEEKPVLDATDSAGSPTLSRSLSARERRRDEVKRSFSSMNQTLPPLGHNRALPALSATMPALKSSPGKENGEEVSRSLPSEVNGDLHNGKLSNQESAEEDFQEEKMDQLKKRKASSLSHPKASPRRTLPHFKAKNSDDENIAKRDDAENVAKSDDAENAAKSDDDENVAKSGSEGNAGSGSEGDAENDDFGEEEKANGKRKKEKKAKHRKKKESDDEKENLENELTKQLSQAEDSEHDGSAKDAAEETKLPGLKEELDKAEDSWEESAEELFEDLSPLAKNPVPVPRKKADGDGKKDEEKTSDLESEEEEKDEEIHRSDIDNEKEEKEKEDKVTEKEDEVDTKEDEEIEKEEDKKKKGKKDKKDKKDKDKKKKIDEDVEEEEDKDEEKEDSKDKGKKKDKKDKKKDKNKDKKKKDEEEEEEEEEKEKEDEKADKKSKDKKKDKKDKDKDKKKKDKKGKDEDEEDEKEEKDKEEEEEEEEDEKKKGKDKKKDKKEDKKKKKDGKKSKDENDNTEKGTTKKSRTCTIL